MRARISKDGGIEPTPPPEVLAVYVGDRKLGPEEWRGLGDGRVELLADRRGKPVTFHARGEA